MPTTFRVPCPRHSPDKTTVFKVTTEFTKQGKLHVLTCVICGFFKEKVEVIEPKVPTSAYRAVQVRPSEWVSGSSREVRAKTDM